MCANMYEYRRYFKCNTSLSPETLCASIVSCHGNDCVFVRAGEHAVNVLSCDGLGVVIWKGSSSPSSALRASLFILSTTSRRCFVFGSFLDLKAGILSCGVLGPSGAAPLWEKTLKQCLPSYECCLPDSGSRGDVEPFQRRVCSGCHTAAEQTAGQSLLCPTGAHGWWELEVCTEERGRT